MSDLLGRILCFCGAHAWRRISTYPERYSASEEPLRLERCDRCGLEEWRVAS